MKEKNVFNLFKLPSRPIEIGINEKWGRIEEKIGTILPTDYKQFINQFGTVCFGRFLWPFNPFSKNKYRNLIEQHKLKIKATKYFEDKFGKEESPYGIFPDQDGLLLWGGTDNGDTLFWLTKGNPDNWPVVINETRSPSYEEYEESMTNFITKLLTGKIKSKIITLDLFDKNQMFLPADKVRY